MQPDSWRHADARAKLDITKRSRPHHGSARNENRTGGAAQKNQIGEVGKPQRSGSELRKNPADQRSGGAAEKIRRRGDASGAALVVSRIKFGDPGGGRAGGETGRKTAHSARYEQPSGALRRGKDDRAGDTDCDSRQACRPAADLVGKAAEEQQCSQVTEDVGRVNQRQCDAGKSKCLPVQRIKRRRQDRADEHDAELGGDRGKREAIVIGGCGIAHCHTSITFRSIYIAYGIPP